MIRLYKIFIRPLFEYGHTATISATDNAIGIWENNQTQYIKKVLNLPNISKENIRKFGNITIIRTRINDLTLRWYTNLYKNDNSPIIEFVDTQITDYHKMDKHDSPYRKITQLIAEQKNSQNKAPESTMEWTTRLTPSWMKIVSVDRDESYPCRSLRASWGKEGTISPY